MIWPGQAKLMIEVAELKAKLSAEENRRERAELELSRLQDDFKGLVHITAGRVPPRLAPDFGGEDPYREDTSLPETFLTPDPELLEMADGEAAVEQVAQAHGGTERRED
jgi:hypothetical protein